MWIKRALFRNIGRHRELDIYFQRGLVGIFGPNGWGKSTIVDGIYACLTNDWSRFAGVKLDNIRDTADPDEESSITVWGEHGDVPFEVFRRLRRAESEKRKKGLRKDNELIVDGKTFDKDEDIRRELTVRLGVNHKLIGTHVFVAQREMFRFVSDTPGDRAATFQMLCGTEKAKQIVDAIEALLEQDKELLVVVDDNSDEINARIGGRAVELQAAKEELAAATALLLPKKRRLLSKTVIEKRQAWRRAVKAITALKPTIVARKKEVSSAELKYTVTSTELNALAAAFKRDKPLAEEARATLKRITEYNERQEVQGNIERRLADARTKVKELGDRPPLHASDDNRERLVEERGTLRVEYRENKTLLTTFAIEGVVKCPTCGTSVRDLDEHLRLVKVKQPRLKARGLKLANLIEAIDAARAAREAYDKERRKADAKVSEYEALLKHAKVSDPPKGDAKALQRVVDDFDALEKKYDKARQVNGDAVTAVSTAKARHDAVVQQRADLRVERDGNVVTDEELERAKKRMARHEAAKVNVAALKQKVEGIEAAQAQDVEELERLKAKLAKNKKAHQFAAKLKKIAEVMHRQALPQMVAQSNLQDMEGDINKILDMFGSPFWVETAEDLTFTVHFPGEPPRNAQRLSVGQKGVLAMAFRPAISALFDAEIGMMTLDEPTADMDERNRGFMAAALAQYAAQVRGRRQVIVITHANELRQSFDQVVELGAHGN